MCEKIRLNLEMLNSSPEVGRVDPETGEVQTMNEEEHQREVEQARAIQEQYC